MPRLGHYFHAALWVCVGTLTFSSLASASEPLSNKLSVRYTLAKVKKFWIADCDGDGWDDLVARGTEPEDGYTDRVNAFNIVGGTVRSLDQINIRRGEVGAACCADLDRDGEPEVVVSLADGEGAWVEVWQPTPTVLLRASAPVVTQDRDGSGRWDGRLEVRAVTDIDMDGIPDVICAISAGMDRRPRGIVVFSGETLDILFQHETAGPVSALKLGRHADPSHAVICFGTTAVMNGNSVGGFSDYHGNFYVLDHTGSFLWGDCCMSSPGSWGFDCGDIDSDGSCEIVLCRESAEGAPLKPFRLEIKEALTNTVEKNFDIPVLMTDISAVDLDGDTKAELVAVLSDNTFRVYDQELDILSERHQEGITRVYAVCDVDLDGKPEILATVGNSSVVVFDRNLNPIARKELPGMVRKVAFAATERSGGYILALAGTDVIIMKLTGNIIPGMPLGWITLTMGVGFALGGVAGGTIVAARARSRSRAKTRPRARIARDELLSCLAEFGHSGLARSNLGRLAQYCETVPESGSPKRPEHERRLHSIVKTYHEFTRGLLLRIARVGARWGESKGVASDLQRDINELDELLPPGQDATSSLITATGASEKVSALARRIHDRMVVLRRRVLAAYRADVPGAVCSVVASMRERLAEHGVGEIHISFQGEGLAQVEEQTLKTCLEILITNAAEAMADSAKREIAVSVRETQATVTVEVSDTGCGIRREDWERVFTREYSTKGEDRGLGLYHVRQALGRYGASVSVKASSPQGTTVALRLKRSEKTAPAPSPVEGDDDPSSSDVSSTPRAPTETGATGPVAEGRGRTRGAQAEPRSAEGPDRRAR